MSFWTRVEAKATTLSHPTDTPATTAPPKPAPPDAVERTTTAPTIATKDTGRPRPPATKPDPELAGGFSTVKEVAGAAFDARVGGLNATAKAAEEAAKTAPTAAEAASASGAAASAKDAARNTKVAAGLAGWALSSVGHYFGDNPVADTKVGHAIASGGKGAADTASGIAVAAAAQGSKTWSVSGIVAGVVDGYLPADHPLKLPVTIVKDVQPGAPIGNGVSAVVDLGVTAVNSVHSPKSARRGIGRIEDNALNGAYGHIVQYGTIAMSYLLDDHQSVSKATDIAAKTGERGTALAFGNFLADSLMPTAGIEKERGNMGSVESSAHMHGQAAALASVGNPAEGATVTPIERGRARTVVREAAERNLFNEDGLDRGALLEYLPPLDPASLSRFVTGHDVGGVHDRVARGIENAYRIVQDSPIQGASEPAEARVRFAPTERPVQGD